jgi:hypothetical protein
MGPPRASSRPAGDGGEERHRLIRAPGKALGTVRPTLLELDTFDWGYRLVTCDD